MKQGEKHRHFGSTNMNAHSSRSHTIFKMIIESAEYHEGAGKGKSLEDADNVVMSQLNLVDLAGSERAERTVGRAFSIVRARRSAAAGMKREHVAVERMSSAATGVHARH